MLVLAEFMSLDGVVQAPGGKQEDTDGGFQHGGWSMRYFDEGTMGAKVGEAMTSADAMLFGRKTWEISAAHWPDRAGDDFVDTLNSIPKYVASRTLSDDDMNAWSNSRLLPADDALGEIAKLKTDQRIHCYGSANLAAQMIQNDLVDELMLMIEPVILGGGKRLFPEDGTLRDFELASSITAPTGVQVCTYVRK